MFRMIKIIFRAFLIVLAIIFLLAFIPAYIAACFWLMFSSIIPQLPLERIASIRVASITSLEPVPASIRKPILRFSASNPHTSTSLTEDIGASFVKLNAGTGLALPICIALVTGGSAIMAYSNEISVWISKRYECPGCGQKNWYVVEEREYKHWWE